MWIQKVAGGGVEGLAFSPDGKTLYTSNRSGRITAWDTTAREGRRLVRLNEVERCNFIHIYTLDEKSLLTSALHWIVWDVETGIEQSRLPIEFNQRINKLHQTRIYGHSAAHRSVFTWDLLAAQSGPVLDGWDLVGDLRSFDLSRDGTTALLIDSHGYVTLFDLATRQERDRFEPDFSPSMLFGGWFSPGGDTLFLKSDYRIRLWDVEARKARGEVVLHPYCQWVFAFHPTAPLFAALNAKGELTLFRLETGEPIRSLDFALGRSVQCVAFAPDGLTCAVGGSNKQFVVFDVDL